MEPFLDINIDRSPTDDGPLTARCCSIIPCDSLRMLLAASSCSLVIVLDPRPIIHRRSSLWIDYLGCVAL